MANLNINTMVSVSKISWPFFLISAVVHGSGIWYAYVSFQGNQEFSQQSIVLPMIDICFEPSMAALVSVKSLPPPVEGDPVLKREDKKTKVAPKNAATKKKAHKKETPPVGEISDMEKIGISVRPVYMPQPDYPLDARKAGFEGTVVLTVKVNQAGQVVAVHSLSKNKVPVSVIDAAMKAAKQWRFVVTGILTTAFAQPTIDVQIPFVFQLGVFQPDFFQLDAVHSNA